MCTLSARSVSTIHTKIRSIFGRTGAGVRGGAGASIRGAAQATAPPRDTRSMRTARSAQRDRSQFPSVQRALAGPSNNVGDPAAASSLVTRTSAVVAGVAAP